MSRCGREFSSIMAAPTGSSAHDLVADVAVAVDAGQTLVARAGMTGLEVLFRMAADAGRVVHLRGHLLDRPIGVERVALGQVAAQAVA